MKPITVKHPLLVFAALSVGLGELLIWIAQSIPPGYHHMLPWLIRLMTAGWVLVGVVLLHMACAQAAERTVTRIRGLIRRRAAGD